MNLKKILIITTIFYFAFDSFGQSVLHKQNELLLSKQSTGEEIASDSINQEMIDYFFPIYITEIRTLDGEIIRGHRQRNVLEDYQSIKTRNNEIVTIENDDIAELSWEIGGRKDFSFFQGLGFTGVLTNFENINLLTGLKLFLGWEFHSDVFIQANYNNSFTPLFSNENEVFSAMLAGNIQGGYRFNREARVTHSISAGIGSGFFVYEDGLSFPFTIDASYDIEFALGHTSGLSIITDICFVPQDIKSSYLSIGLTYRRYSTRLSQMLRMINQFNNTHSNF